MTTIEATFRVTTPMFCGGAKPAVAELRESSFKGVLRFWWRACAWSALGGHLETIRQQEECLFGGPTEGRSRVTVRLRQLSVAKQLSASDVLTAQGTRYLGYGMTGTEGNRSDRGALASPLDFAVELRARELADGERQLLVKALRALGTLGGMGARSRRGWGSLSLITIDGDAEPERLGPLDQLRDRLRGFRPATPDRLPEYTALSSRSRFLIGRHGATGATAVLNQLGEEYQAFRQSNRKDGRLSTMEGDKSIVLDCRPADAYPKRVAFGLPVNYGKGRPVVEPAGGSRRASPLFVHVHDCGGRPVPVVSFLPANFLPSREPTVAWRRDGAQERKLPEADPLYQPVHVFLDYLIDGGRFEPVGEENA